MSQVSYLQEQIYFLWITIFTKGCFIDLNSLRVKERSYIKSYTSFYKHFPWCWTYTLILYLVTLKFSLVTFEKSVLPTFSAFGIAHQLTLKVASSSGGSIVTKVSVISSYSWRCYQKLLSLDVNWFRK